MKKQTEKQFQAAVTDYARLCGWRFYHPYRSTKSVPGFPDLTLTRRGRLVFAELKRDSTCKLTSEQHDWWVALTEVQNATGGRVEAHVWRPSDWTLIERTLR